MALAVNTPRTFAPELSTPDQSMGQTKGTTIYEGSALSHPADGFVNPITTAEEFAGFSMQKSISPSTDTDGDKAVMVRREGMVLLNVTGVSGVGEMGQAVYASDDGTFTLTASTNVSIGRAHMWVSGTQCWVRFTSESYDAKA